MGVGYDIRWSSVPVIWFTAAGVLTITLRRQHADDGVTKISSRVLTLFVEHGPICKRKYIDNDLINSTLLFNMIISQALFTTIWMALYKSVVTPVH